MPKWLLSCIDVCRERGILLRGSEEKEETRDCEKEVTVSEEL
jgi:hypothetical protein